MSDILTELLERGAAQGAVWVTQDEWKQVVVELRSTGAYPSPPWPPPPEGSTLWGMPVHLKIDYLTEVVKAYAPKEEE